MSTLNLDPAGGLPPLSELPEWFDQIVRFVAEANQLEAALEAERKRSLTTEQELRGQVMQREKNLEKETIQTKELRLDLAKARGENTRAKEAEDKALRSLDIRTNELIRVQTELKRYQSAWTGVLDREKAAARLEEEIQQKLRVSEQVRIAYEQECEKNKRLEVDHQSTRQTLERLLAEARAQSREYEHQLQRVQEAQVQQRQYENGLQERVRALSEECRLVREELHHYKQAWSGVIEREKEAKSIIHDHERDRTKIEELQKKLQTAQKDLEEEKEKSQQLDRHGKRYQSELQHALVRIHSAESKFSELTQEYQSMSKRKRDMDAEVHGLEQTIRERLDWQFKKDQERFKAEIEKEAALDREDFRSEVRDKLRQEYESRLDEEKLRYERMKAKYQMRISELESENRTSTKESSDQAPVLEATGSGAISVSSATPPPMVLRFPKRPDLDC